MNPVITIQDILPNGMTCGQLLPILQKQILDVNGNQTALERGAAISQAFPKLAEHTVHLAEDAMKGMLLLPGTGPDLFFVGNPPKWTFNPVNNNEYTFHLNRMHHLKTLAEAYSITGNLDYAQKALEELSHWIDYVPCPDLFDKAYGYAAGNFEGLSPWRALETGIRGYRTWPLIIELLADTPFFTEDLLEKILCSTYTHCQILYKISPLLWPKADHNHYLMENLGLMSFSCLFPKMKDSILFLAHSQRELDRCMEVQCTPCGGQIEGCPSYHNGCVFWFAMRIVFARKFHIKVSDAYTQQLKKMFRHSVLVTRSCGGNFPWGDSHIADKETLSLAAVACYMAYEDPEYLATALYFYPVSTILEDIRDNLWRIPNVRKLKQVIEQAVIKPAKPTLPLVVWQKDLSQAYIRTSWEKDAISLMTACRTPVQNLHAHIDAGGFDLTAYGEPLVTDPGIYTYKEGDNRRHFKSAFWHNCLTVNHKNMWEYLSSWGYGPQKEGHIVSVTEETGLVTIVSCHKNYEPAEVFRVLSLLDNRLLVIIDEVRHLKKDDSVQIHFHLDRTFVRLISHGLITQTQGRPNVELVYSSRMDTRLETGKISTRNDVWHDSTVLHLNHIMKEPGTFIHCTLVIPRITGETDISCYDFHTEQTSKGFFISFRLSNVAVSYRLLWTGKKLQQL